MARPLIVFRASAGAGIGLGHLRRSLALAGALKREGADCRFVVDRDPTVVAYLERSRVQFWEVEPEADRNLKATRGILASAAAAVVVVDSYEFTGRAIGAIRESKVVVIDDMADRKLPVDLIVNSAPAADRLRYRVGDQTRLLLGAKYMFVRQEFLTSRPRRIGSRLNRVMITVGGMDDTGLSARLILCARKALPSVRIDAVAGPLFSAKSLSKLRALARKDARLTVLQAPPTLHRIMKAVDLAITGGGQTTFELAASGTPAIALRIADNQTGALDALHARGTLEWIGDAAADQVSERLVAALQRLERDSAARRRMSAAGRRTVDGKGLGRTAREILSLARPGSLSKQSPNAGSGKVGSGSRRSR